MIEITPEYEAVLAAIARKDPFIFISGRAGTGKTTLVNYLRNNLTEQVAVVAPTGVAALQVRGDYLIKTRLNHICYLHVRVTDRSGLTEFSRFLDP